MSKTFPAVAQPFSVNALSIMRAIANQDRKSNLCLIDQKEINTNLNLGKKVFCKFYLVPNQTNKIPLFFMLDSGSDVSLISLNLINKLLTQAEIDLYKRPCSISIESFSNHTVKLEYNLRLPFKFSHSQTYPVFLEFSVFSHNSSFPILLGQESMSVLKMSLIFPPENPLSCPIVTVNYPTFTKLKVRFMHPAEAQTCFANINIGPAEMQPIIFQPHETMNIKKGDILLISESNTPGIYIFPSRCEAYSRSDKPLIAHVTNLSNKAFSGKIKGKVENLDDFNVIRNKTDLDVLPEYNTGMNEVLDYKLQAPFDKLRKIQMLEKLPHRTQSVNPLTAYLLLTPFESTQNGANHTNSGQEIKQRSEILEKLNIENPTLSGEEKTEIKNQLQNKTCDPNSSTGDSNHYQELSEIPPDIILPRGYSKPNELNTTVQDVVKLEDFEEIHRPYIKDIFIDKFPSLISLHAYDIGDLSASLGLYNIKLKKGEVLPRFRKIYYLSQEMRMHMQTILDYLIKYKIISRAPQDDNGQHLVGSPCYLVGKHDKSQSYRMVVDFKVINSVISNPIPIIPDITSVLHSLQNQALFTLVDLSSAYYSVGITPECRHITTFACPLGKFIFNKLPMGLSSSPAYFQELALKMLHYKPELDASGQPIFNGPNRMQLHWDPIHQATLFFDDLLIYTPLAKDFNATLKLHYETVSKVMARLALHRAKIGFAKSIFGQSQIKYLGWIISNGYIVPDKQRINKLLNAPFPVNQKAMRSFTALINTIKMVCPHQLIQPLKILLPLTGSTTQYC